MERQEILNVHNKPSKEKWADINLKHNNLLETQKKRDKADRQ